VAVNEDNSSYIYNLQQYDIAGKSPAGSTDSYYLVSYNSEAAFIDAAFGYSDLSGGFNSVDSYIDPFDPEIIKLLAGIPELDNPGLSTEEKLAKLYNYIINNFNYVAEDKDDWNFVSETIYQRGGDCEDLSILLASAMISLLMQEGLDYQTANSRVSAVAGQHALYGDHVFVEYLTEDGNTYVLDAAFAEQGNINKLSDLKQVKELDFNVYFRFNDNKVFGEAPALAADCTRAYIDPQQECLQKIIEQFEQEVDLHNVSPDELAIKLFNFIKSEFQHVDAPGLALGMEQLINIKAGSAQELTLLYTNLLLAMAARLELPDVPDVRLCEAERDGEKEYVIIYKDASGTDRVFDFTDKIVDPLLQISLLNSVRDMLSINCYIPAADLGALVNYGTQYSLDNNLFSRSVKRFNPNAGYVADATSSTYNTLKEKDIKTITDFYDSEMWVPGVWTGTTFGQAKSAVNSLKPSNPHGNTAEGKTAYNQNFYQTNQYDTQRAVADMANIGNYLNTSGNFWTFDDAEFEKARARLLFQRAILSLMAMLVEAENEAYNIVAAELEWQEEGYKSMKASQIISAETDYLVKGVNELKKEAVGVVTQHNQLMESILTKEKDAIQQATDRVLMLAGVGVAVLSALTSLGLMSGVTALKWVGAALVPVFGIGIPILAAATVLAPVVGKVFGYVTAGFTLAQDANKMAFAIEKYNEIADPKEAAAAKNLVNSQSSMRNILVKSGVDTYLSSAQATKGKSGSALNAISSNFVAQYATLDGMSSVKFRRGPDGLVYDDDESILLLERELTVQQGLNRLLVSMHSAKANSRNAVHTEMTSKSGYTSSSLAESMTEQEQSLIMEKFNELKQLRQEYAAAFNQKVQADNNQKKMITKFAVDTAAYAIGIATSFIPMLGFGPETCLGIANTLFNALDFMWDADDLRPHLATNMLLGPSLAAPDYSANNPFAGTGYDYYTDALFSTYGSSGIVGKLKNWIDAGSVINFNSSARVGASGSSSDRGAAGESSEFEYNAPDPMAEANAANQKENRPQPNIVWSGYNISNLKSALLQDFVRRYSQYSASGSSLSLNNREMSEAERAYLHELINSQYNANAAKIDDLFASASVPYNTQTGTGRSYQTGPYTAGAGDSAYSYYETHYYAYSVELDHATSGVSAFVNKYAGRYALNGNTLTIKADVVMTAAEKAELLQALATDRDNSIADADELYHNSNFRFRVKTDGLSDSDLDALDARTGGLFYYDSNTKYLYLKGTLTEDGLNAMIGQGGYTSINEAGEEEYHAHTSDMSGAAQSAVRSLYEQSRRNLIGEDDKDKETGEYKEKDKFLFDPKMVGGSLSAANIAYINNQPNLYYDAVTRSLYVLGGELSEEQRRRLKQNAASNAEREAIDALIDMIDPSAAYAKDAPADPGSELNGEMNTSMSGASGLSGNETVGIAGFADDGQTKDYITQFSGNVENFRMMYRARIALMRQSLVELVNIKRAMYMLRRYELESRNIVHQEMTNATTYQVTNTAEALLSAEYQYFSSVVAAYASREEQRVQTNNARFERKIQREKSFYMGLAGPFSYVVGMIYDSTRPNSYLKINLDLKNVNINGGVGADAADKLNQTTGYKYDAATGAFSVTKVDDGVNVYDYDYDKYIKETSSDAFLGIKIKHITSDFGALSADIEKIYSSTYVAAVLQSLYSSRSASRSMVHQIMTNINNLTLSSYSGSAISTDNQYTTAKAQDLSKNVSDLVALKQKKADAEQAQAADSFKVTVQLLSLTFQVPMGIAALVAPTPEIGTFIEILNAVASLINAVFDLIYSIWQYFALEDLVKKGAEDMQSATEHASKKGKQNADGEGTADLQAQSMGELSNVDTGNAAGAKFQLGLVQANMKKIERVNAALRKLARAKSESRSKISSKISGIGGAQITNAAEQVAGLESGLAEALIGELINMAQNQEALEKKKDAVIDQIISSAGSTINSATSLASSIDRAGDQAGMTDEEREDFAETASAANNKGNKNAIDLAMGGMGGDKASGTAKIQVPTGKDKDGNPTFKEVTLNIQKDEKGNMIVLDGSGHVVGQKSKMEEGSEKPTEFKSAYNKKDLAVMGDWRKGTGLGGIISSEGSIANAGRGFADFGKMFAGKHEGGVLGNLGKGMVGLLVGLVQAANTVSKILSGDLMRWGNIAATPKTMQHSTQTGSITSTTPAEPEQPPPPPPPPPEQIKGSGSVTQGSRGTTLTAGKATVGVEKEEKKNSHPEDVYGVIDTARQLSVDGSTDVQGNIGNKAQAGGFKAADVIAAFANGLGLEGATFSSIIKGFAANQNAMADGETLDPDKNFIVVDANQSINGKNIFAGNRKDNNGNIYTVSGKGEVKVTGPDGKLIGTIVDPTRAKEIAKEHGLENTSGFEINRNVNGKNYFDARMITKGIVGSREVVDPSTFSYSAANGGAFELKFSDTTGATDTTKAIKGSLVLDSASGRATHISVDGQKKPIEIGSDGKCIVDGVELSVDPVQNGYSITAAEVVGPEVAIDEWKLDISIGGMEISGTIGYDKKGKLQLLQDGVPVGSVIDNGNGTFKFEAGNKYGSISGIFDINTGAIKKAEVEIFGEDGGKYSLDASYKSGAIVLTATAEASSGSVDNTKTITTGAEQDTAPAPEELTIQIGGATYKITKNENGVLTVENTHDDNDKEQYTLDTGGRSLADIQKSGGDFDLLGADGKIAGRVSIGTGQTTTNEDGSSTTTNEISVNMNPDSPKKTLDLSDLWTTMQYVTNAVDAMLREFVNSRSTASKVGGAAGGERMAALLAALDPRDAREVMSIMVEAYDNGAEKLSTTEDVSKAVVHLMMGAGDDGGHGSAKGSLADYAIRGIVDWGTDKYIENKSIEARNNAIAGALSDAQVLEMVNLYRPEGSSEIVDAGEARAMLLGTAAGRQILDDLGKDFAKGLKGLLKGKTDETSVNLAAAALLEITVTKDPTSQESKEKAQAVEALLKDSTIGGKSAAELADMPAEARSMYVIDSVLGQVDAVRSGLKNKSNEVKPLAEQYVSASRQAKMHRQHTEFKTASTEAAAKARAAAMAKLPAGYTAVTVSGRTAKDENNNTIKLPPLTYGYKINDDGSVSVALPTRAEGYTPEELAEVAGHAKNSAEEAAQAQETAQTITSLSITYATGPAEEDLQVKSYTIGAGGITPSSTLQTDTPEDAQPTRTAQWQEYNSLQSLQEIYQADRTVFYTDNPQHYDLHNEAELQSFCRDAAAGLIPGVSVVEGGIQNGETVTHVKVDSRLLLNTHLDEVQTLLSGQGSIELTLTDKDGGTHIKKGTVVQRPTIELTQAKLDDVNRRLGSSSLSAGERSRLQTEQSRLSAEIEKLQGLPAELDSLQGERQDAQNELNRLRGQTDSATVQTEGEPGTPAAVPEQGQPEQINSKDKEKEIAKLEKQIAKIDKQIAKNEAQQYTTNKNPSYKDFNLPASGNGGISSEDCMTMAASSRLAAQSMRAARDPELRKSAEQVYYTLSVINNSLGSLDNYSPSSCIAKMYMRTDNYWLPQGPGNLNLSALESNTPVADRTEQLLTMNTALNRHISAVEAFPGAPEWNSFGGQAGMLGADKDGDGKYDSGLYGTREELRTEMERHQAELSRQSDELGSADYPRSGKLGAKQDEIDAHKKQPPPDSASQEVKDNYERKLSGLNRELKQLESEQTKLGTDINRLESELTPPEAPAETPPETGIPPANTTQTAAVPNEAGDAAGGTADAGDVNKSAASIQTAIPTHSPTALDEGILSVYREANGLVQARQQIARQNPELTAMAEAFANNPEFMQLMLMNIAYKAHISGKSPAQMPEYCMVMAALQLASTQIDDEIARLQSESKGLGQDDALRLRKNEIAAELNRLQDLQNVINDVQNRFSDIVNKLCQSLSENYVNALNDGVKVKFEELAPRHLLQRASYLQSQADVMSRLLQNKKEEDKLDALIMRLSKDGVLDIGERREVFRQSLETVGVRAGSAVHGRVMLAYDRVLSAAVQNNSRQDSQQADPLDAVLENLYTELRTAGALTENDAAALNTLFSSSDAGDKVLSLKEVLVDLTTCLDNNPEFTAYLTEQDIQSREQAVSLFLNKGLKFLSSQVDTLRFYESDVDMSANASPDTQENIVVSGIMANYFSCPPHPGTGENKISLTPERWQSVQSGLKDIYAMSGLTPEERAEKILDLLVPGATEKKKDMTEAELNAFNDACSKQIAIAKQLAGGEEKAPAAAVINEYLTYSTGALADEQRQLNADPDPGQHALRSLNTRRSTALQGMITALGVTEAQIESWQPIRNSAETARAASSRTRLGDLPAGTALENADNMALNQFYREVLIPADVSRRDSTQKASDSFQRHMAQMSQLDQSENNTAGGVLANDEHRAHGGRLTAAQLIAAVAAESSGLLGAAGDKLEAVTGSDTEEFDTRLSRLYNILDIAYDALGRSDASGLSAKDTAFLTEILTAKNDRIAWLVSGNMFRHDTEVPAAILDRALPDGRREAEAIQTQDFIVSMLAAKLPAKDTTGGGKNNLTKDQLNIISQLTGSGLQQTLNSSNYELVADKDGKQTVIITLSGNNKYTLRPEEISDGQGGTKIVYSNAMALQEAGLVGLLPGETQKAGEPPDNGLLGAERAALTCYIDAEEIEGVLPLNNAPLAPATVSVSDIVWEPDGKAILWEQMYANAQKTGNALGATNGQTFMEIWTENMKQQFDRVGGLQNLTITINQQYDNSGANSITLGKERTNAILNLFLPEEHDRKSVSASVLHTYKDTSKIGTRGENLDDAACQYNGTVIGNIAHDIRENYATANISAYDWSKYAAGTDNPPGLQNDGHIILVTEDPAAYNNCKKFYEELSPEQRERTHIVVQNDTLSGITGDTYADAKSGVRTIYAEGSGYSLPEDGEKISVRVGAGTPPETREFTVVGKDEPAGKITLSCAGVEYVANIAGGEISFADNATIPSGEKTLKFNSNRMQRIDYTALGLGTPRQQADDNRLKIKPVTELATASKPEPAPVLN
jgi:transglutaminase-like putative cysteine protease